MERQIFALTNLAICAFLLAACSDGSGNKGRTMFIEHYKSSCQGSAYQTCLLTRESEQAPWTYFYDSIEYFDYEWGYRYEIRVRITDIPNPPEDASSLAFSLLEVVSKKSVDADTPFEFSLFPVDSFSERLSDTEFSLAHETSFTCDLSTCDTVDSLLAQELALLLEFYHATEQAGPLRLQRVKCSDSPLQFYESCLHSGVSG